MFKLPKFDVHWAALFARPVRHLAIQLAGCAAILAGIAHYSHAAALIVGGLGAVIAIERQS